MYNIMDQIFWEVVGLERGPLSLVSTIEELLRRNCSVSGHKNREYGRRDPSRWPRDTLFTQKLTLTSPTNGVRLIGVARSRTGLTYVYTWDAMWSDVSEQRTAYFWVDE
jgi:hypothetical protein